MNYPVTPDGRYFVVRGRLWRCTNPQLPEDQRERLVRELMNARRGVKTAKDDEFKLSQARARIHQAKIELGERGPVWWTDGSPDYNRQPVSRTPYREWHQRLL